MLYCRPILCNLINKIQCCPNIRATLDLPSFICVIVRLFFCNTKNISRYVVMVSIDYLRTCTSRLVHLCTYALAQVLVDLRTCASISEALANLRKYLIAHFCRWATCALAFCASTCALAYLCKYLCTCILAHLSNYLCTCTLMHLHTYAFAQVFTHLNNCTLDFCTFK